MRELRVETIPLQLARRMRAEAVSAKTNTYPEPGNYAAAVLTKSGNIHTGVAYKSDTYTLTMHAEATALAHAAIHGEKDIIAITGPNCHICKQLLWESALHSGIDIQVVMENKTGIQLVPISSQMPFPWPEINGNYNLVDIDRNLISFTVAQIDAKHWFET